MNILFITQTKFLALLLEKLFKDESQIELHTRTEIDDVLYLIRDLDVDLLFLDVDNLTEEFWSGLKPICQELGENLRLVFTGLDENILKAPIKPIARIKKPLEAITIKERLTSLFDRN